LSPLGDECDACLCVSDAWDMIVDMLDKRQPVDKVNKVKNKKKRERERKKE
jgi:hypothetical protein